LGYDLWRDQFAGDPGVIGRSVTVNGEPAQIIGVMPQGFGFPNNNNAWLPMRDDPLANPRADGANLMAYGRLRDGVTREQAERELVGIAAQIAREHPAENEGVSARLETIPRAATNGPLNIVFGSMMIAVFCVLLVACANVANLLLARAATRTKEAAVRSAMGGSRLRVMLPFFAEALVLAGAGAVLGILIAHVAVGWFDAVTDPARTGRPYFIRFLIDWPIVGFVVGVTVFTALAAGVAPALKMSRTDVSTVLKDEGRGSTGLSIGRLSLVLVTAEVALSCALLVGAGLMTKSIVKLGSLEHGFEPGRLLTARLGLPEADYPDPGARARFWEDLTRELQSIPEVASVGLTSQLPMNGAPRRTVALDGVAYENAEAMPDIPRAVVTAGFFETLGVSVQGRSFLPQDDPGSERVAIVNQSMVDRYFDRESPLGRQFREGAPDTLPRVTVVGVVPDLAALPPGDDDPEPAAYYVPVAQNSPAGLAIIVAPRAGEARALTSTLRSAVARVDSELPLFNVYTQEEVIDRATWFYGVFGTVFIVFGLAALFMASVGLYGVLSFAVSRRTQEMGIRMALGADSGDVVKLVVRQGLLQLGVGLGVGLAMAFGVTRLIGVLMYQVDPQDPMVFAGVLGTIVLVGLAASFVPARRASSVDPMVALRHE
jgi:predicted permease